MLDQSYRYLASVQYLYSYNYLETHYIDGLDRTQVGKIGRKFGVFLKNITGRPKSSVCVCACVRACVRACVCMGVHVCLSVYM